MWLMFSRAESLSRRAKALRRANRESRYTAARKAPSARAENNKIFLRMVIKQALGWTRAVNSGPQSASAVLMLISIEYQLIPLPTVGVHAQPCRGNYHGDSPSNIASALFISGEVTTSLVTLVTVANRPMRPTRSYASKTRPL